MFESLFQSNYHFSSSKQCYGVSFEIFEAM